MTEGAGVRLTEFLSPDCVPPGGGCLLRRRSSRDLASAEQRGSLMEECRRFLKSDRQVHRWRSACYFRACQFLVDRIGLLPEFYLLLDSIHPSWNRFAILNPSRDSSSSLWNYRENSKENVKETMGEGHSLMHSQEAESSSRSLPAKMHLQPEVVGGVCKLVGTIQGRWHKLPSTQGDVFQLLANILVFLQNLPNF